MGKKAYICTYNYSSLLSVFYVTGLTYLINSAVSHFQNFW